MTAYGRAPGIRDAAAAGFRSAIRLSSFRGWLRDTRNDISTRAEARAGARTEMKFRRSGRYEGPAPGVTQRN
jgi:hypothetical protein